MADMVVSTTREQIHKDIYNLVMQLSVRARDFSDSILDSNFFCKNISLSARDLVYLTHLVEVQFGYAFTTEDFDSDEFYSIGGMANILLRTIK